MRILMLSWEYPPLVEGGLAAHVKGLAEALTSLGHQIHVVTPAKESKEEEIEGVHIHRVKFGTFSEGEFPITIVQDNIGLINKATEIIEKEQVHLIHAHDWLVSYSAQSLKHLHQLPLITTIHATEHGRNRGIHNSLQWYIHQTEWGLTFESWHVICCSQFMLGELTTQFDLPNDKISVIPNGIHFDGFHETYVDKSQYAGENEKIIFSLGRLVYEKGFQTLIDAAPLILERHPDAKFVIAGKGYYHDTLQEKIHALGLAHKFHFPGFITDEERNSLYQMASVAVFPSLYEPFGIVALEAMALGTPVVASEVGGLSEVIEHNMDGMKFQSNDPHSLADNISFLLENNYFAECLGTKGFEKVQNLYTWDRIATLTEEVYDKIYKNFLESDWGKSKRVLIWSGFKSKEIEGKKTNELREKEQEEATKV